VPTRPWPLGRRDPPSSRRPAAPPWQSERELNPHLCDQDAFSQRARPAIIRLHSESGQPAKHGPALRGQCFSAGPFSPITKSATGQRPAAPGGVSESKARQFVAVCRACHLRRGGRPVTLGGAGLRPDQAHGESGLASGPTRRMGRAGLRSLACVPLPRRLATKPFTFASNASCRCCQNMVVILSGRL
jgi:hypothetical protein